MGQLVLRGLKAPLSGTPLSLWGAKPARTLSDRPVPVNRPGRGLYAPSSTRELQIIGHCERLRVALVECVLDLHAQLAFFVRHEVETEARIVADREIHFGAHHRLACVGHRDAAHELRRLARIEITR